MTIVVGALALVLFAFAGCALGDATDGTGKVASVLLAIVFAACGTILLTAHLGGS